MLNINNLLPLIQMMSGSDKNQNIQDIINAFSNSDNQNNNGNNIFDMFKNMQGNSNMNILSLLPVLQNMFGPKKPGFQEKEKTPEKNIDADTTPKDNYLKPISKIANKDITYILNRYFS